MVTADGEATAAGAVAGGDVGRGDATVCAEAASVKAAINKDSAKASRAKLKRNGWPISRNT